MLGEPRRPAVIWETRPIIRVRRQPRPPRQSYISSRAQRVPLIVIQQKQTTRRIERGEAARSFTPALRALTRIRRVNLAAPQNRRRPYRNLPAIHARALYGERQKNVGVAQCIVIEEISALGVKVVRVESPSSERNRNAKLVFFIAFAAQRQETESLL